jgi:hypothetical protein
MTIVLRHVTDVERARKQVAALETKPARFLQLLEKNTAALDAVLNWTLSTLQCRSLLDPVAKDPAIWRDLRISAQAATAIFVAAETPAGQIECEVGGPVRFAATGPRDAANAGAWLRAMWLAVIDRNDDLIQQLCAVSLDTLRASGAEHDAYIYPWVEVVRNFVAHKEISAELFTAALDGTDPDNARIMIQLIYPPIQMFYHLLRRDGEKFNTAFEQALEQHKKYWTGHLERADQPDGYIALAPLAIAVLARSVGLSITVESEYAPTNFVHGIRP